MSAFEFNPLTRQLDLVNTGSGGGGGSLTLAAIGSAPNANGATLTGTVLNLEPADASFGGVVSTAAQNFTGEKTFLDDVFVTRVEPRITLTDTGDLDNPTAYWEKLTTNNEARLVSQNRPFIAGAAIDCSVANNGGTFSYTLNDFSISFWIKTTSTSQNMFAGNVANNTALLVYHEAGNFNLRVSGSTVSWAYPSATLGNNTWQHIVFAVAQNGNSEVYVNGISLGTVTAPNAAAVFTHILRAGTGGSTARGTFDEYIIFDSHIDAIKVAELYQAGTPYKFTNYTGVYAAYHLDTGSGATYVDSSGNGRDAVATTAPTWTTGIVAPIVEPAADVRLINIVNNAVNLSRGTLTVGEYLGSTSTTNIYEGLTHTFKKLGVNLFAIDSAGSTLASSLSITGALNIALNNDITMAAGSGRIRVGSTGSAATPAIICVSAATTGINWNGSAQLDFVTGGVVRVQLSNSTTRFQFGSIAVPGIGHTGDTDQGMYGSAGVVGISSGNYSAVEWTNNTTTHNNVVSTVFNTNGVRSFETTATAFVVNENGVDRDFRVEGDTDANLIFVDASTDRVGFGTNTPGFKVDVVGEVNASVAYRIGGVVGFTGTGAYTNFTIVGGIITAAS